jgi:hypothetical protein
MEIRRFALWIVFLVLTVMAGADRASSALVIREGGKTYIVDQRGERWDITQAQTLGFDPKGFQYGIGRNAFTPLTDSYVRKEESGLSGRTRVIGVAEGKEKRAYSVPRLSRHEIANSTLGGKQIAVRRPSGCVQPPNRREDADDRPHRVDLPEHLRALRPGNEHIVVSVQERAQGDPGEAFRSLVAEASLRGHDVGPLADGQSDLGNPAIAAGQAKHSPQGS